MAHIVLTFDNNRLASALYGQFDENLARIEQKLGVDVRSKGNQLSIRGEPTATEQARRALDHLYETLQKGHELTTSDVDGALRMAIAADDQLTLPTMENKGKLSAAQISTRKKTIFARTPTQDAYMRALDRSELVFGVGLPVRARPIWPSPMPPCFSNAGLWNASSCRARLSRQASVSASCRAT